MAEKEVIETSEAEIAVHWGEEEYYHPSTEFIAQANMADPDVLERFSLDNFPNCFKEYADILDWFEYWDTILDTSDVMHPAGNGSKAVKSMPATIAWIVIWPKIKTRPPFILSPNWNRKKPNTSPIKNSM
jgi:hypothetical protein